MSNQETVKKASEILKDLGHEVSTGHLYELFSKLAGHKSWNVANAKKADFHVQVVEPMIEKKTIEAPDKSLDFFEVELQVGDANTDTSPELVKEYLIQAESGDQAKA